MRITEIRIYQASLPVKNGPYTYSGGALYEFDSTVIQVLTDKGLIGYGECCPHGAVYAPEHALGARAALSEMAPHLIGENPLHIHKIIANMDAHLCGHDYAKAAVDIAMWDLAGKFYDVRICDLLGGARSEQVKSYYTTGSVTADEAVKIALDKRDQGFDRLQIKVGGRPVAIDIEVIHKVYEAIGSSMSLCADANRGWSTKDAIFASNQLRDVPVVFEQPCNSLEEIEMIRGIINHPIYLDEGAKDIKTLVSIAGKGLCDGFGFKLTRLKGITGLAQARDICKARHLPHTCDDSWGGDIIAAACVHVGSTVDPKLNEGVWIAQPYIEGHYDSINSITLKNGKIQVPTGPGLGVNPEIEKLGNPCIEFG